MSRFSGKCDFYDHIAIHGLDSVLASRVYVGRSTEPLKLVTRADCIPYYPYVISSCGCTHGGGTIYLMEKSWVDIEEEQLGHLKIHDFYREALAEELQNAKIKMAADESAHMYNGVWLDRARFVRNLGELLSQTREGIKGAYLDEHDRVHVTFKSNPGYEKVINVSCDSYMAIIRDVTKQL